MNSLKVSNFLNSVGGMGDEERPPLGERASLRELATLGALEALAWPRCSGRTRACATWGRCVKYAPIGMLHSYVGIPMLQSYELICSSCCGPHSAACIMPQQDEHLKCASALAPRYSHCPAWSVQQQSNASAILWLTSCRPRPRTARSHTSYRSAPKS